MKEAMRGAKFSSSRPTSFACSLAHNETFAPDRGPLPFFVVFLSFRQQRNGLHFVLSRAPRAGAAARGQEQWSSGAQGRLGEVRFVFSNVVDDGGFRISLALPCRRRPVFSLLLLLSLIRLLFLSRSPASLLYLLLPLPLQTLVQRHVDCAQDLDASLGAQVRSKSVGKKKDVGVD